MFLQSQGEVQNIQIVSETEENGYINVTIRADIYPDQNQCANLQLKKELLISPFFIENREQAIAGQLYELDQASTSLFIQKLEESSGSSLIKLLPQSIRQKELSYADRGALQRNYGGRYLLKASLGDVSLGERVGTNWAFWSDQERERPEVLAQAAVRRVHQDRGARRLDPGGLARVHHPELPMGQIEGHRPNPGQTTQRHANEVLLGGAVHSRN